MMAGGLDVAVGDRHEHRGVGGDALPLLVALDALGRERDVDDQGLGGVEQIDVDVTEQLVVRQLDEQRDGPPRSAAGSRTTVAHRRVGRRARGAWPPPPRAGRSPARPTPPAAGSSHSRISMFSASDCAEPVARRRVPTRSTGRDRSTKMPPPGPRRMEIRPSLVSRVRAWAIVGPATSNSFCRSDLRPRRSPGRILPVDDPRLDRAPDRLGTRVEVGERVTVGHRGSPLVACVTPRASPRCASALTLLDVFIIVFLVLRRR